MMQFNKKYLFLILFLFFSINISNVEAAVLYIKPSQTSASIGDIVSVQVSVDTSAKVINNAESIIQFPTDLLEVVSLDSKSSIFSLWVEQPSFSNNTGQIIFNGGLPNPGFIGNNGKIISIIFKTKKTGTASIVFSNSAVRENDGLGTDILTNSIGSSIKISDNLTPTIIPNQINTTNNNPVLNVISSTHPKQDVWYKNRDVSLNWVLPKNTTSVKTLLGSYPDSDTSVYYKTPISNKNISNLEDGIWYFHVNYLANGSWSKVSHYRINIDNTIPKNLNISTVKDDLGRVTLAMSAEDNLSGIDYFKISVDSDEPILVNSDSDGKSSIVLSFSSVGEHKIVVTVFDKAGNYVDAEAKVITDYISKLTIDSYSSKIKVSENIEIFGTSPYPYALLSISIKNKDSIVENYKIKSDSYSKYHFVSPTMSNEGKYILWVDALKDNGEVRITSEKIDIEVEKPIILQIGSYTTELLSVLVPAVILLIILIFIMYYGWYKFFGLHRRLKRDLEQTEDRIHKSFKILYDEASKQLEVLEKSSRHKKLTNKEEEAIENIKSSIVQLDKFIKKEIDKIE